MRKSIRIIPLLVLACDSGSGSAPTLPVAPTLQSYKLGQGPFPSELGSNPVLDIIDLSAQTVQVYWDLRRCEFPALCDATDGTAQDRVAHLYEMRLIPQLADYAKNSGLELGFALDISPDRTNHLGSDSAGTFDSPGCAGGPIGVADRHLGNPVLVDALKEEARYVARVLRPRYFAFGVEIEAYLKDATAQERDDFWMAFREIKQTALTEAAGVGNTQMQFFCYFNFENVNESVPNLWPILVGHQNESDLYAFSSYPILSSRFDSVGASFPLDYYDAIESYFGNSKSIAFTELGQPWNNDALGSLYDVGSDGETDQRDWMQAFFQSMDRHNQVEFIIYLTPHDFDWARPSTTIFDHMGLRSRQTGRARAAWDVWIGRSAR